MGQRLDIEFTSQPPVRTATQLFFDLFPLNLSARETVVERKPDKSAEEREGHFSFFFFFSSSCAPTQCHIHHILTSTGWKVLSAMDFGS